jgi:hypothetical protein
MKPLHLIHTYWTIVRARGDKPRPVYALLDGAGTMVGWSLNRRESKRKAAERGDCRIEKVTP